MKFAGSVIMSYGGLNGANVLWFDLAPSSLEASAVKAGGSGGVGSSSFYCAI